MKDEIAFLTEQASNANQENDKNLKQVESLKELIDTLRSDQHNKTHDTTTTSCNNDFDEDTFAKLLQVKVFQFLCSLNLTYTSNSTRNPPFLFRIFD